MRVSMKYNSAQSACESFSYGEVEDYTVNIGQSFTGFADTSNSETLGNETSSMVQVYPNPVSGNLVNVRMNVENVTYTVYDLVGKVIVKGNLFNNVIDVSTLSSGIYILKLNDGQKDIVHKLIKE